MTVLRTILFSLALSSGVLAAVNGPCSADGTPGVCISTSSCRGAGGKSATGFCPNDPADVKCCTRTSCGSSGGNCRWASQCSGTTQTGLCPGPADFKCCNPGGGSPPGGGTPGTSKDLSPNGVTFISGFEGFRSNFYNDAAGVKTIGYGHACQPDSSCNSIKPPITEPEGKELLKKDAVRFVKCVNDNVKVTLNQNQFDALVSFAFNLGCGNLQNIAENLNRNDFTGATNRMKEYNRAGGQVLAGLTRRRQAEVDLFNK
ncbi:MAG: hypothetical protein M1833_003377 [Piccolia ochrophora]|nr:MAG: hypothetical protein M1833_003377 [Piccolia ochrophora]